MVAELPNQILAQQQHQVSLKSAITNKVRASKKSRKRRALATLLRRVQEVCDAHPIEERTDFETEDDF